MHILQEFWKLLHIAFFLETQLDLCDFFFFLTLKNTNIPALLMSNLQQAYTRCSDTWKNKEQKQNTHICRIHWKRWTISSFSYWIGLVSGNPKEKQTKNPINTTPPNLELLYLRILPLPSVKANCWASVKFLVNKTPVHFPNGHNKSHYKVYKFLLFYYT